MKRYYWIGLLLSLFLVFSPACYTVKHQVGAGAQGGATVSEGAWYILFGLIPLNSPSSSSMAGNARNYTITTQFTFVDYIINFFTGFVTISKQTVKVEK